MDHPSENVAVEGAADVEPTLAGDAAAAANPTEDVHQPSSLSRQQASTSSAAASPPVGHDNGGEGEHLGDLLDEEEPVEHVLASVQNHADGAENSAAGGSDANQQPINVFDVDSDDSVHGNAGTDSDDAIEVISQHIIAPVPPPQRLDSNDSDEITIMSQIKTPSKKRSLRNTLSVASADSIDDSIVVINSQEGDDGIVGDDVINSSRIFARGRRTRLPTPNVANRRRPAKFKPAGNVWLDCLASGNYEDLKIMYHEAANYPGRLTNDVFPTIQSFLRARARKTIRSATTDATKFDAFIDVLSVKNAVMTKVFEHDLNLEEILAPDYKTYESYLNGGAATISKFIAPYIDGIMSKKDLAASADSAADPATGASTSSATTVKSPLKHRSYSTSSYLPPLTSVDLDHVAECVKLIPLVSEGIDDITTKIRLSLGRRLLRYKNSLDSERELVEIIKRYCTASGGADAAKKAADGLTNADFQRARAAAAANQQQVDIIQPDDMSMLERMIRDKALSVTLNQEFQQFIRQVAEMSISDLPHPIVHDAESYMTPAKRGRGRGSRGGSARGRGGGVGRGGGRGGVIGAAAAAVVAVAGQAAAAINAVGGGYGAAAPPPAPPYMPAAQVIINGVHHHNFHHLPGVMHPHHAIPNVLINVNPGNMQVHVNGNIIGGGGAFHPIQQMGGWNGNPNFFHHQHHHPNAVSAAVHGGSSSNAAAVEVNPCDTGGNPLANVTERDILNCQNNGLMTNISVDVLSQSTWPVSTMTGFDCKALPERALNAYELFVNFFMVKKPKRHLQLQPKMGNAEILLTIPNDTAGADIIDQSDFAAADNHNAAENKNIDIFEAALSSSVAAGSSSNQAGDAASGRTYLLHVTTAQMIVLQHFENDEPQAFDDLLEKTCLPPLDLTRALETLCMPTNKGAKQKDRSNLLLKLAKPVPKPISQLHDANEDEFLSCDDSDDVKPSSSSGSRRVPTVAAEPVASSSAQAVAAVEQAEERLAKLSLLAVDNIGPNTLYMYNKNFRPLRREWRAPRSWTEEKVYAEALEALAASYSAKGSGGASAPGLDTSQFDIEDLSYNEQQRQGVIDARLMAVLKHATAKVLTEDELIARVRDELKVRFFTSQKFVKERLDNLITRNLIKRDVRSKKVKKVRYVP